MTKVITGVKFIDGLEVDQNAAWFFLNTRFDYNSTVKEFYFLIPYFKESLLSSEYTLEGSKRKNSLAEYKNSPLASLEEKLFFIVLYLKQNPTQCFLGSFFSMTQPKANQWIHFLTPVLQRALSKAKLLPCREGKELSKQEGFLFSHDGTERPIQRPKNKKKQKLPLYAVDIIT